jgi:hypothetical protein
MVYEDHIAITSGNKSTTGREDFCRGMPLLPELASLSVSESILIVASG